MSHTHAARLDALDLEADAPVVDEDGVARLHVFGEALVLDGDGLFFGEDRFARVLDQRDLAAWAARRRRRGERAGADLGAAQILQGGDRLFAAGRRCAQRLEPPACSCVAAVREVEARDIHPRVDEPLERFERIAGGTDGANYFGLSFKH